MVRIQIILLALAASFLAFDVHACSCDIGSIDESFEESAAAFQIRVTATELRPSTELEFVRIAAEEDVTEDEIAEFIEEAPEYVRISFEVIEVFKGESHIPSYLYEMVFSPGNCGLVLATGIEYVIFLSGEPIEFASFCTGSFGFFNAEGDAIKPDLDRLRELAK